MHLKLFLQFILLVFINSACNPNACIIIIDEWKDLNGFHECVCMLFVIEHMNACNQSNLLFSSCSRFFLGYRDFWAFNQIKTVCWILKWVEWMHICTQVFLAVYRCFISNNCAQFFLISSFIHIWWHSFVAFFPILETFSCHIYAYFVFFVLFWPELASSFSMGHIRWWVTVICWECAPSIPALNIIGVLYRSNALYVSHNVFFVVFWF